MKSACERMSSGTRVRVFSTQPRLVYEPGDCAYMSSHLLHLFSYELARLPLALGNRHHPFVANTSAKFSIGNAAHTFPIRIGRRHEP